MQAFVDQINRLNEEMERLRVDVDDNSEEIVALHNEQVIEEHFYINDEFRIPDDYVCFESFSVPAGMSLDFKASVSSYWAKDNGTTSGALYLQKNGEVVAWHRHVKGIPGTWFTHTA